MIQLHDVIGTFLINDMNGDNIGMYIQECATI